MLVYYVQKHNVNNLLSYVKGHSIFIYYLVLTDIFICTILLYINNITILDNKIFKSPSIYYIINPSYK